MDWTALWHNALIILVFCALGDLFCYLKYKWSVITKINVIVTYVLIVVCPTVNYVVWLDADDKKSVIIACVVMFFVILIPLVIYVRKVILAPMQNLRKNINTLANGDLTQKADISARDEFGEMARDINKVIDNFNIVVSQVKGASDINIKLAEDLSSQSEEVNSSLEQVSATIQEVAKSAQGLSKNASAAEQNSEKTKDSAFKGSASADSISKAMNDISVSTEQEAMKIRFLGDKSKEIGMIIETINTISQQTNLLALNAAIEAARAGDAGRGFAVVADEVRKLAEQSQRATSQITGLIKGIQEQIDASVVSMVENSSLVKQGMAAVNGALESFAQIPALADQVNRAISEVSAVAEENAAGSEEISASVEQVTSSMQTVASSAQKLSQSSMDLKKQVERFKIRHE